MLERQLRGLDHGWRRNLGWSVQFVILMPFAGPAATEGYQARLGAVLHKQFNLELEGTVISSKSIYLNTEEPMLQLAGLLVNER